MGNLIRVKQVDQVEFSGLIRQVGDPNYYQSSNPSGYISSVSSDSSFIALSGNLNTTSGNLNSSISNASGALNVKIQSTGSFLQSEVSSLSGQLFTTNTNLSVVSGNVDYSVYLTTGLQNQVSGIISGQTASFNSGILSASGTLNSKITNVSGLLNARVSSLETSFSTSGSNFVDVVSDNQTISGSKSFSNRVGFKQIDLLPYSGNYANPGGQHGILFTQFIDNQTFYASGLGTITGDYFITKIMQPNNIECVISSMIYTGAY
jgi:hypothetical protein